MGSTIRTEHNFLASARNQSGYAKKNWWAPPINYANKHVAFIMSPIKGGNTTSKRVIVGRTTGDLYARLNSKEMQDYVKANNSIIVSKSDFEQYFSLQDDVFFDGMNYADSSKTATGAAASLDIEEGKAYIDEVLETIRNQVNSIGKRTIAASFEPQIEMARMMSAMQPGKGTNIYNVYQEALLGSGGLNAQYGLGKLYRTAESIYDDLLQKIADKQYGKQLRDKVSPVANKRLRKVQAELDDAAPVNLTTENLERTPKPVSYTHLTLPTIYSV